MKFLRESGTAEERAGMEDHISYLADKGLETPPEESRLKIDPRYCVSQTQWRDCLRRQFSMAELGLEIRTLYAQLVGGPLLLEFGVGVVGVLA